MGRYYDDDYISHSSGPWKKHKYISKKGSGPNAVYVYAKKAGEYLTGGDSKATAKKYNALGDKYSDKSWDERGRGPKADQNKIRKYVDKADEAYGVAANAKKYYDNNTLPGKVKKAAKNARLDAEIAKDNAIYAAGHATGISQKKSLKKAKSNYSKAHKASVAANKEWHEDANNIAKRDKVVDAYHNSRVAHDKLESAQKKYNKTPLGKAERTVKSTKRKARKAVSNADKFLNSTSKEVKRRLKNSRGKTNLKNAKKLGPHTYATFEEPKVAPKGKQTSQSYSDYEKQKKRQQSKKASKGKNTVRLDKHTYATFEEPKVAPKGKQTSQSYSDYEKQKKQKQAKKAPKGKKTVRLGKHTYATFDEAKLK